MWVGTPATLFLIGLILLLGILAMAFGAIAKDQIKKNPKMRGRGLAIAGFILGLLGLVGFRIFYRL